MNLESMFCGALCTAGVKTAKLCAFTGRELEVAHVLVPALESPSLQQQACDLPRSPSLTQSTLRLPLPPT